MNASKAGKARIVFVTGANRGIGLQIVRELAKKGDHVLIGCRTLAKAKKAAALLAKENLKVEPIAIDVSKPASIQSAVKKILKKHKRVDVLINNAGIFEGSTETFKTKPKDLEAVFRTNTLGPFLLCQLLAPGMQKRGYGRIVNLSSGLGQLSEMETGYPAYRISKTAINAVTRIFSAESEGKNVLVNSVCPGWVKTDMGGKEAEREIPKGAETPVWLANLPDGGPSGAFFRDREVIAW